jgi:hypothetical protein
MNVVPNDQERNAGAESQDSGAGTEGSSEEVRGVGDGCSGGRGVSGQAAVSAGDTGGSTDSGRSAAATEPCYDDGTRNRNARYPE